MGIGSSTATGAAAGSAFGPWGTVIGAGIGLFGSLFGAHSQSKSADYAAKLQADAANRAADQQAQAAREALAFQQAQAENSYQNTETTRKANYDQWAAKQRRYAALYKARGWGDLEIPGYVPGVDPGFPSSGQPSTPAPASLLPGAQPGAARTPVVPSIDQIMTRPQAASAPMPPAAGQPPVTAIVPPPPTQIPPVRSIDDYLSAMPGYRRLA